MFRKLLLFWILVALPVLGFGQNISDKIDPWLIERFLERSTAGFIAVLADQADVVAANDISGKVAKATYVFETLQQKAQETQGRLLQQLAQKGVSSRSFFLINAIYAEGDLQLVQWMAQQPEVAYVYDNSEVVVDPELPVIDETTLRGPNAIEWGLERINADDVWNLGFKGQGVVVGGQDTGYEWYHPAIMGKYRGWNGVTTDHNYNWHDAIHEIDASSPDTLNPCGLNTLEPCDDHNHGTHTMGTMVGLDGDNVIGVAPEARWIGCRNMERGAGTPATYIECFQWFMAPTDLNGQFPNPAKAPHVIANSWSCPESEGCNPSNFELMRQAVDNLKFSGVVIVVSAGNSGGAGCGSVSTPAAIFESSFTVGATAENDTITGFSSRGPVTVDGSERTKPNVSAPGRNVRSCIRNGEYASWAGTSMAGPHVAGAAALVICANPSLAGEVETVETILEQTAVPKFTDQNCGPVLGAEHPNNTYGYGRIDALAAVQAALNLLDIGAEPKETLHAQLAPNPFQDQILLTLTGPAGEATLALYDINGRQILQRTWWSGGTSFQNLPTWNLADGMYVYTVRLNDQFIQGKVIKNY